MASEFQLRAWAVIATILAGLLWLQLRGAAEDNRRLCEQISLQTDLFAVNPVVEADRIIRRVTDGVERVTMVGEILAEDSEFGEAARSWDVTLRRLEALCAARGYDHQE
ncbi:hypothetical protein [Falsiroseomonas tokyonensis]|uniref:Uncharacterized protein n=1 Tax=Falsiroseomonas tokyonensis TaxID=430521 RepID=A0ABV7BR50_9PROT|nr:hypothetical protein [Falsiroseomonas tokyonensis]MBU8538021.1 hypothetical protein [Falsiroseomonas tokyonensis]